MATTGPEELKLVIVPQGHLGTVLELECAVATHWREADGASGAQKSTFLHEPQPILLRWASYPTLRSSWLPL